MPKMPLRPTLNFVPPRKPDLPVAKVKKTPTEKDSNRGRPIYGRSPQGEFFH